VLSRLIAALVGSGELETVIVHPGAGPWFDLGRRTCRVASRVAVSGPPTARDAAWLEVWRRAGQAVWRRLEAEPWPNGPAIAALVARIGPNAGAGGPAGPLVAGASSAIRDLDLVPAPKSARPLLAMRGLAGIDGTIGFAAGVALAAGQPATALLGDLALAHDCGALTVPEHERPPDVRIVALEDHGGAIFENLEVAGPGLEPAFERFFATPAGLELAALARAHGAGFSRAETPERLAAALRRPIRGFELVAVSLDRAARRGFERRIAKAFEKCPVASQELLSDERGFVQDDAV
jgi:2-succinyl-5-enolpyruvyl-6-hydroxy-3-cyclohexene-1-carboxylate synthase